MSIFRKLLMAGITEIPESRIIRYIADTEASIDYSYFNSKVLFHEYNPDTKEGEIITVRDNININLCSFTSNIEELILPNTITSISGGGANCNIKKLNVPKNVNSLYGAFKNVENVYIEDIYSFCNCSSDYYIHNYSEKTKLFINDELVEHLIIPEGVTNINGYLFEELKTITGLTLPNSLVSIRDMAFCGCSNLNNVIISEENLTTIGDNVFGGCTSLPIDENGLRYADSILIESTDSTIKSVIIKDGTICIDNSAFNEHYNLEDVTLPDSLKIIHAHAFSDVRLNNLIIPDSVIQIDSWAFYYGNADYLYIGANVSNVDFFYNHFHANEINVSENNTIYDSRNNCNCVILSAENKLVYLGGNGFIDESVTVLGNHCITTYKEHFIVPDNIITIEDNISQESLKKITIGKNVKFIGSSFTQNTEEIVCNNPILPTIEDETFISIKDNGLLRCYDNDEYDNWIRNYLTNWRILKEDLPTLTLEGYDIAVTVVQQVDKTVKLFNNSDNIEEININGQTIDIVQEYDFGKYGIPHIIRYKLKDNTITGDNIFYNCDLWDILLSDTITTISANSFYKNTNLSTTGITDNVTDLGASAYANCKNINDVTLNNVENIGSSAFDGCSNLEYLTLSENTRIIESYAFRETRIKSLVLPENIERIGYYAFNKCTSLENVTINCENADLTEAIFKGCTSLPKENDVYYADRMLVETTKFDDNYNIVIKEGTKWIGGEAFFDRYEKCKVNLPASVTSIGCRSMSTMVDNFSMTDNVTVIGKSAFYNSPLTSIVLSKNITRIPNNLFDSCTKLTSINIPSNVEYIGEDAFYKCTSLINLVIPDKVKHLDSIIRGCNSLTTLTLGSGIETIGDYAVYDNPKLKRIISKATVTPTITNLSFRYVSNGGTLKYPKGSDYSSWLKNEIGYLGYYGWTGIETEF